MKDRQYKKLCKKAAELIGLHKCGVEDGVFYVSWSCGGDSGEYDSEDAWPHMEALFHNDVNVMIDDKSEWGTCWVDDKDWVKSTPKNVFKWAKSNKASIQWS